jgi:hypothetical protein
MPVLPRNDQPLIDFALVHANLWEADPESVGLSAQRVAAYTDLAKLARDAMSRAIAARDAAAAATTELHARLNDLRAESGAIVAQIKAFAVSGAQAQRSPLEVYAAAAIPPRAPRRGPAPPGRPTDIRIGLQNGGAVTLSWTAPGSARSSGGGFVVSRRLYGQPKADGEEAGRIERYVPGTSRRQRRAVFVDDTLPADAAARGGAIYEITPIRGDRRGEPSEAILVTLGVGPTPAATPTTPTTGATTGALRAAA